jgi:exonuclease III
VKLLLEVLEEKYAKKHLWSENLILLGDTNIYSNNQDIVALFGQSKFIESAGLAGKMTNVSQTEIYDRLFFRVNEFFKLIQRNGQDSGDVLRFFDTIYTEARRADYHTFMLAHKNDPTTLTSDTKFRDYYHHYWKRNQMSDHYPVWIEIEIDSSDDFLIDRLNILQD